MGNEFYDSGEGRVAKVNNLFTRIAPRYDLINDLQSFGLHRYWKRHLVGLTRMQRDDNVLDLCCGTGDLALLLARRGAQVLGADFNAGMLEVAQNRARELPPNALRWVRADALSLPFVDRSFDVVTVAYGLRNLADVRTGLGEMQRVAQPRAMTLGLEFG